MGRTAAAAHTNLEASCQRQPPLVTHCYCSNRCAGTYKSARSIWLITTLYLNPVGKDLVPVLAALVERYKFVKAPSTESITEATDRFLHDVLSWFSASYGMPDYRELLRQKLYVSELVVQMKLPPTIFSEKFARFVKHLHGGLSNEPGVPMELSALHFGPDPAKSKKVAPFRLERAAGAPFERNEFYSGAPLPTQEHLELLSELDRAASA